MKYFILFHILPAEIVNIIINKIYENSISSIVYFYKKRSFEKHIIQKNLICILFEYNLQNFISETNISNLKLILNNNWINCFDREFLSCFAHILSDRIMKNNISINLDHILSLNFIYYNNKIKKITKLWFKFCVKYNLIIAVCYYQFKSRKADNYIVLPARCFRKPINNFQNILYPPNILVNKNNDYIYITRDYAFNKLNKIYTVIVS